MINTEKLEEFKVAAQNLYNSLDNKDVNILVVFTKFKVSKEDNEEMNKVLSEALGKEMIVVFTKPNETFVDRTITFASFKKISVKEE